MQLLVAGTALWCATHLFPALAPQRRAALKNRLGDNGYGGIITLLLVASILMIVFGWKAATPSVVYAPPLSAGPLVSVLILMGFVLFFASRTRSHARQYLRHPQLAGFLLWTITHLLSTGDARSLVLFGGFTAWALLEVVLIDRRDGKTAGRPRGTTRGDVIALGIGMLAYTVFAYFHLSLFGVPAMLRG